MVGGGGDNSIHPHTNPHTFSTNGMAEWWLPFDMYKPAVDLSTNNNNKRSRGDTSGDGRGGVSVIKSFQYTPTSQQQEQQVTTNVILSPQPSHSMTDTHNRIIPSPSSNLIDHTSSSEPIDDAPPPPVVSIS
jgi:hypothetical protein